MMLLGVYELAGWGLLTTAGATLLLFGALNRESVPIGRGRCRRRFKSSMGDKPTLTLKTPGDVQNAIGVAGTISTKDDLGPCRGNSR